MGKICWHYDLLYFGGIETSLLTLLKQFSDKNMFVAHRQQYFTRKDTYERIKNVVDIVDTDKEKEVKADIAVFSGMIFDYPTIFNKIKAKKRIGWIHFIPGEQCVFENMLIYPEYTNKIDYWVCVSETSKRGLLKYIPNAKVEVIHNTINEEEIKRLATVPIKLYDNRQLSFVTSARLSQEKGIELMIEFIKRIHDSGISYVWYLLGDGIDPDTIEMINEAREKYNIVTPGFVENPYNIISKCDYGLLLSPRESWGIFPDECHILGIPTITLNWDAIYERENIENYGIILKPDLSNLKINEILSKKGIYKENLKSYKYINDLNKWYNLFSRIYKEIE